VCFDGRNTRLEAHNRVAIIAAMLTINIGWEYFFGIIGTLVALAYYANGRFTRIETNVEWLTEAVRDLSIKAENVSALAFGSHSPVSLTETGEQLLRDSGLKAYIDRRREELTTQIGVFTALDLYTVQQRAFHFFGHLSLESSFARHLDRFAFRKGVSTDLLRRVGAIYLRDVAVTPR
jgi:hypothetical protein